jgi:hypothetical protein
VEEQKLVQGDKRAVMAQYFHRGIQNSFRVSIHGMRQSLQWKQVGFIYKIAWNLEKLIDSVLHWVRLHIASPCPPLPCTWGQPVASYREDPVLLPTSCSKGRGTGCTLQTLHPLFSMFPSATASSQFLTGRTMKINLQNAFGQIDCKMKKIILY